jgi:hypothetical protein
MPVAPQVGRSLRYDDGVAGARFDGLVAAGTDVAPPRLVRLDPPHLQIVVVGRRYS